MNAISTEAADRVRRREAVLLVLAFAFLTLNAAILGLRAVADGAAAATGVFLLPPLWAVTAWLLHRSFQSSLPERDPLLLPCGMLLMGWGVLVVWRLLPEYGARQLVWFLAVSGILYEIARMRSATLWLRRYRLVWLSAGLALLAVTLFLGTNPSGGEARLWLGCCGQYVQPSEPLRLLLIAYLASFLADRMMPGTDEASPIGLSAIVVPLLVVWGGAVALLTAQHDLGAGSLFLAILIVLLYLAFQRWSIVAIGGLLLLAAGIAAQQMSTVVNARIQAWLNPWNDPLALSYQPLQGLFALATGGLFGVGPGAGSPGLVPAIHTDYIFAALTEEWGLAGGLAILVLLTVITARGLRAATLGRDSYAAILAGGLAIMIGLQAFLILAGVLRVLPVTGVPVPFVSYGGSSLITTGIALGLLIRISAHPGERPRFAVSIRKIHTGALLLCLILGLALGWWTIVRGPELLGRPENPRPVPTSAAAPGLSLRGRPEPVLDPSFQARV